MSRSFNKIPSADLREMLNNAERSLQEILSRPDRNSSLFTNSIQYYRILISDLRTELQKRLQGGARAPWELQEEIDQILRPQLDNARQDLEDVRANLRRLQRKLNRANRNLSNPNYLNLESLPAQIQRLEAEIAQDNADIAYLEDVIIQIEVRISKLYRQIHGDRGGKKRLHFSF